MEPITAKRNQSQAPIFKLGPSPRATNTLPGGLLLGQGSSLNTCGGDLQVGVSRNAHKSINNAIIDRAQEIEKRKLGELAHLSLKKTFKTYKPDE